MKLETLAAHLYEQARRRAHWTQPLTHRTPELADVSEDAKEALAAALHLLPHGAGIDDDWLTTMLESYNVAGGEPNIGALKIRFHFHPMNENGYYVAWRYYTATVRPGWHGIEVYIEDTTDAEDHENFEDILDYLYDVFGESLSQPVIWDYTPTDGHTVRLTTEEEKT